MDDSEEERKLKTLTFDQIKEIAEEGVDPNLPTKEKRKLYAENFEEFMKDSDLYYRTIYQIIGQKLLDEITSPFDDRKRTDPPDSQIHKYDTMADYINDQNSERENLYVNEEAELIFSSLADGLALFEENPQNTRFNDYFDRPIAGWNWQDRKSIQRKTKRRPQRYPRRWLSRGGSKSKRNQKPRSKRTHFKKNKKTKRRLR